MAHFLGPSTTGRLVGACRPLTGWGHKFSVSQIMLWPGLLRWWGREFSHSFSTLWNHGLFSVSQCDWGWCGHEDSGFTEVATSLWLPNPLVMVPRYGVGPSNYRVWTSLLWHPGPDLVCAFKAEDWGTLSQFLVPFKLPLFFWSQTYWCWCELEDHELVEVTSFLRWSDPPASGSTNYRVWPLSLMAARICSSLSF